MTDSKGYTAIPVREGPPQSPSTENAQESGCIRSIDEADVNCSSHIFKYIVYY